MSELPSISVREVVNDAVRRLAEAGVAEPRREAIQLWEAASGGARGSAWRRGADLASDDALARFRGQLDRRAAGSPLAHVLGEWSFRHLDLTITPDVLIPRPETEGLVDLLLARVQHGRVADLGTGSGCIALALGSEGDFGQVVAVDASAAALAVARHNARRCGIRLDLIHADFGGSLAEGMFDAVVSNPPYLSEAEYAGLDPSVKRFEPQLALESGADGLRATRAVVADAARALRPGGWLALEIDATRAHESACVAQAAGFAGVTIHQDLFGRERFLLAQRSTR
ncbi:MAG TPA: peptide chain release factor N(5)-glutamine methyltransferase [Gemmatimonadales bacterium]|nr:peptide chain release factor N(5)-glutamine methyltransferase [Gemmatimonadales bacterium]